MKINKPNNWSEKTIIIAEDDINNYLYLKAVLFDTRAKIVHAKNGIEAVELCRTIPNIDLILMDIIMPGMGGIKAATIINEFRNDVPIIAQSALFPEYTLKQNLSKEFAAYILKPFKPVDIINIIQKQFSGHSRIEHSLK